MPTCGPAPLDNQCCGARRQLSTNRTLNGILRRTLQAAASGVRGSAKPAPPSIELFNDAVVEPRVRLIAVAMPFVVAAMASCDAGAPWRS